MRFFMPAKTITFDDKPHRVLPGEGDHFAKSGTASLLGGLDVHKFVCDLKATAGSIRSQQIELGRDGEAFALLIL
jgi:hypothetical protein